MARKGAPQVVILCEDRAQYHFVRKYLQLHGVTKVHQRMAPPGRGSAEHWVRCQFPPEVRGYRSRRSYRNIALAVMIDADRYSVAQRKDQLDSSLASSPPGQNARGDGENIAIFVPKWSLETWFRFLEGANWTEETSYRTRYRSAAPTEYAGMLFDACRQQQLPCKRPPSLSDACEEWPRLGLG